jgi:Kef-type K+ transport system membrane component KefB
MELEILHSMYFKLLILLTFIWIVGKLFRAVSLPVIFGELLAGIIVGPVVLNLVQPSETIQILADLGVFFLMLHAGLETDPEQIQKHFKKSIWIALGGFILPFITGYLVTSHLGLELGPKLFISLGISITAVAIVTRVLRENNLTKHKIYPQIIGASILTDVLALIAFAVIMNVIQFNNVDLLSIVILVTKVVLFFIISILLGFKMEKSGQKIFNWGNRGFTLTLIIALAFGILAEALGLHIIIGAFMAGLFIKENTMHEEIYNKIEDRIYGISYGFLAPIFFINIAFYFKVDAFTENFQLLSIIVIIALLTKSIGAGIASYFLKNSKIQSFMIGFAMNSRGAVDIIIAYEAYKMGFINEDIFSLLIGMIFTTTLISIFGIKFLSKISKNKKMAITSN